MQVFWILVLFFASIFGFGLRDMVAYPLWVPIVFSVLAVASLFTPYMRGGKCSTSNTFV
jgi:hypothetical protein